VARTDPSIFDITMLGAPGTGKTSLLASMYGTFNQVVGGANLTMIPTPKTSTELRRHLQELKSLPQEFVLPAGAGIPGDAQVREHRIGLSRKDAERDLVTLRFTDYPGGYITGNLDGLAKEQVSHALEQAGVILVAIHTSALMEHDGRYHEVVNQPGRITDEVARLLRYPTERLIILVPLRCEKDVYTPAGRTKLTGRVMDAYYPLLNYLRAGDLHQRVGCVLAPVQTVGSVVYSRVEVKQGMDGWFPEFTYRTRTPYAPYAPADTDQPLRYALRFILNKYRDSRGPLRAIFDSVFGKDARLVEAVDRFTAGCKEDESFRILQDHHFLTPGS